MPRLRFLSSWTVLVLVWGCVASVLWFWAPSNSQLFLLDGQPDLWRTQAWRSWTAAVVHWSGMHLLSNLAGCAALIAWGHAADLKLRHTVAWLTAWPLAHLSLSVFTSLPHYGGLSGVLHAGVAIGCWALLHQSHAPRRRVGAMVLLGLCVKVALEQPWLRYQLGLVEAVVPLIGAPGWVVAGSAHLAGLLSGLACAMWVDGAVHISHGFSRAAPAGTAASH